MTNLPSLISRTRLETVRAAPHNASTLLGKLDASRHRIVGPDCACAGTAAAATAPEAASCPKYRREIVMASSPVRAAARACLRYRRRYQAATAPAISAGGASPPRREPLMLDAVQAAV